MRKKRIPSIVLCGLFFDGQTWVPAETYPRATVYTDSVLAGLLGVSKMRINTWRTTGVIPYTDSGSFFAIYDLNTVLKSLEAAGYKIDPTKKSNRI